METDTRYITIVSVKGINFPCFVFKVFPNLDFLVICSTYYVTLSWVEGAPIYSSFMSLAHRNNLYLISKNFLSSIFVFTWLEFFLDSCKVPYS